MRFSFLALLLLPLLPLLGAAQDGDEFSTHGVTGSFILCSTDGDSCERIDADRCAQRFIPASTFKILNSLIALETGAVDGTGEVLPWDGRRHRITSWNQDQDMEHAFQRSCVWFYQELARRIGSERMQAWVDSCDYGNRDIGGGIDRFWLDGALRISQEEQIVLLRRLWHETLPFRRDVQQTVKRLMVLEKGEDYVLSGKTGLADLDGVFTGWLVGFIERGERSWCYALNISSADMEMTDFARLRHTILRALLEERSLL